MTVICTPQSDPAISDETTRSATARAHYAERPYLDTARMYEQLWRDTQAPSTAYPPHQPKRERRCH